MFKCFKSDISQSANGCWCYISSTSFVEINVISNQNKMNNLYIFRCHTIPNGACMVIGRRVARKRPGTMGFNASTRESLTLLLANNRGEDQTAQSDQRLCHFLSEK